MFVILKDCYLIWIVFSFTHLDTAKFSQVLLLCSAFNSAIACLIGELHWIHWEMVPLMTFLIWVLGAAARRPLQLLSFSLFCSSLLAAHLHAFLSAGRQKAWPSGRLLFGVIGGVGGAALVPLDWAQPWQRFPIPVACGLVVGCLVGNILDYIHSLIKHRL